MQSEDHARRVRQTENEVIKIKKADNINLSKTPLRIVKGECCEDKFQWLNTSMIVETKQPWMSEDLAKILKSWWPTMKNIKDMGFFLFLIYFQSVEEMELALKEKHKDFDEACVDIRRWSEEECCYKRCVCLEIFGIPPHAWSRRNMESIVDSIEEMIGMDTETEEGNSMGSAKVLVHTRHMPFVEEVLILSIGESNFEIYIKEIETSSEWVMKHIRTEPMNEEPFDSHVPEIDMDLGWRRRSEEDDDVADQQLEDKHALNEDVMTSVKVGVGNSESQNYTMNVVLEYDADDGLEHLPSRGREDEISSNGQVDKIWNLLEAEESQVKTTQANVSYDID